MRDPDRIDKVLDELKDIWKEMPDLRLGQLILNAVQDPALYYIEDRALIKKIKDLYGC